MSRLEVSGIRMSVTDERQGYSLAMGRSVAAKCGSGSSCCSSSSSCD